MMIMQYKKKKKKKWYPFLEIYNKQESLLRY